MIYFSCMLLDKFKTSHLTYNSNEFKCTLFQSTSQCSFKHDNKTADEKIQIKKNKYFSTKIQKKRKSLMNNESLRRSLNMLNNDTTCNNLLKKKKLLKLIIVSYLILFLSQITSGHLISDLSKKSTTKIENRPDMLCNVGDEHECICNRLLGNLDNKYLSCDNFLEVSF